MHEESLTSSARFRPATFMWLWGVLAMLLVVAGCTSTPEITKDAPVVDRAVIEYPPHFELRPFIRGLTAPTAICFDSDGSLLVAESGFDGAEPRVIGFKSDGTFFEVHPRERQLPVFLSRDFRMYGPIGGMVAVGGKVFVTHRDGEGRGRITMFSYDEKSEPKTIAADLPAMGDYSVTDIAVHPNGRLYFGVGAATNSGVVGLDNLQAGWVKKHPTFCDVPYVNLKLNGFRFDTPNPFASIFGGKDVAVTGPFQKFGASDQTGIPHPNGKPTAAIYSVDPAGGDLKVEAHGIRNPAGLRFNEYGTLYATNQGMELRGTRPIWEDADAFVKIQGGETWYGWPDFSADLRPVTDKELQPPREMALRYGYPDVRFLIDHTASSLIQPVKNELLYGVFRPLAGASKFDFFPSSGPFRKFRERGEAVVALFGDRAPFATSGTPMVTRTGFSVALINTETRKSEDFIRNTLVGPGSAHGKHPDALERPIDVKFGPDGAMYILDFGQLDMKGAEASVKRGTGRIYRMAGTPAVPATQK